jgi:hypothetical protein
MVWGVWIAGGCLTLPAEFQSMRRAIVDQDGDGFVSEEFSEHSGDERMALDLGVDCDDQNAEVFPGADELCDGLDQDCDGVTDEGVPELEGLFMDADGDGFGDPLSPVLVCPAPASAVMDSSDCDDLLAHVFPGSEELCDGLDGDCDGRVDEGLDAPWTPDADGDGWGGQGSAVLSCEAPDGYGPEGDCDDSEPDTHPAATEVCDDGLDNDCDGFGCEPRGDRDAEAFSRLESRHSKSRLGSALLLQSLDGLKDTRPDLIAGAENVETDAGRSGGVFIWSDHGSVMVQDTDTAHFIAGSAAGSRAGAALASSDFDGDGRGGLVVGAPGDDVVYVLDAPLGVDALDEAETAIHGGQRDFGAAVSAIEDVLAVGAPTQGDAGAVLVFQSPEGMVDSSDAVWAFEGLEGEELGSSLELVDVTGDGQEDLLVVSAGSGAVSVFSGPLGAGIGERLMSSVEMDGGAGLATGDVDGDGYVDILHGLPFADDLSGRLEISLGPVLSESSLEAVFTGNGDGVDRFGSEPLLCDLDGSGTLDLFASALGRNSEGGAVLGFYDPDYSGSFDIDDADVEFRVSTPGDSFGHSSVCGRVFGAGPDLVVGSPHWISGDELYGQVVLIEGLGL